VERLATRYVSVGDAEVAYQISGEGPLDLLYFYGVGSHIELHRDHPFHAEFFTRLAAFSRLIVFDLRGTGGSDPLPNEALPSWEDGADDVRAVLDAAGSPRAAVYAESAAGPVAMLFAATQPERVRGRQRRPAARVHGGIKPQTTGPNSHRSGLRRGTARR
jgi:pimeloyl-ACP methyl ester carboxylesterase